KRLHLRLPRAADAAVAHRHLDAVDCHLPELTRFAAHVLEAARPAGRRRYGERFRLRQRRLLRLAPRGGRGRERYVVADADVRREARHAGLGQLLVAERDDAADRRRVLALGVGEAGADGEARAVGQLDAQRTQPALVAAGAGLVLDDARLGVEEPLHLQE